MDKKQKPIDTTKISLSAFEKLGFISNFSTMLSAGIPILETIDSIREDTKGNQNKILGMMREDLTNGKRLYTVFDKFPKVFDKVTVSIVKAAEEAGTLETVLKDIKENIKKDMEFSDKVKSALFYPLIIMIVFSLVLLVILIYVIPRITQVFSQLRVELPLPTKIMLFTSNLLLHYTMPLILSIIFIMLILLILYEKKRKTLLRIFIALPLISTLATQIDLTRFSRGLYLLLSAGIPITNSLELLRGVVIKPEIEKAIIVCQEMISGGKKFSEGLRASKKIFPSIMVKISEAGDKSGSLDKSMLEISEYMDYQVTSNLKTLVAMLEPVMLVFVGIAVGGMMLAIIGPIYSMIGKIGPQ